MADTKQSMGKPVKRSKRKLVEGVLSNIPGQQVLKQAPPPPPELERAPPQAPVADSDNESMTTTRSRAPVGSTRDYDGSADGDASDAEANESMVEQHAAAQGASILLNEPEGFISALAITLIPHALREGSRRIAVVSRPFGFVCCLPNKEKFAVIAPAGYVTDFASIPKFAQGFISPFGKHAEAAVIHDWLYALGDENNPRMRRRARRRADKTFVIALKKLEVGWLTRWMMYSAVRLGGGKGFGRPEEFALRNIDTLEPLNPHPALEPYYQTIATLVPPKSKGGRTTQV